jgi:hypothetical protein
LNDIDEHKNDSEEHASPQNIINPLEVQKLKETSPRTKLVEKVFSTDEYGNAPTAPKHLVPRG